MTPLSSLKPRLKRWADYILPLLVLAASAILYTVRPPILEELQLDVFDAYQRLRPRLYRPAGRAVRIVDLDDATLDRLGQWPWPRTQVAELIVRLAEGGVASVGLDMVFAEPDRTSPARIVSLWPASGDLRSLVQALPDHDQVLSRAIGQAPVVTGFAFTRGQAGRAPAVKTSVAHAGDDPKPFVEAFDAAVVNLPEFETMAAGNGHFNMLADRDGLIRRVPLWLRAGEVLYPSLALETLRVAQGASTYVIKSSGASGETGWGAQTGMVSVKVGEFVVPTDAEGRVWLYDTGPAPERWIPAWRIMAGEVNPDELAGAIILIGTSAAGLKDIRATPLNPVAAGVEVHAQLLEQILHGEFLKRPDWAPGAEFFYLVMVGLLLIVLLPRAGPAWCAAISIGTTVAVLGGAWMAYTAKHWLLDPLYPSMVVLAIYLVASLNTFLRTEAERRHVRRAFSRYMSPELVRRLAEHPEQLRLGGEMRIMTLLFADIRGFTTISEQFDAQGLTHFINQFLTPMTDVILTHRGTIDKYMGDCIMAFWNAPLDDPDHARHACQAALTMRATLVTWNAQRRSEADTAGRRWVPVHLGIGLNTGECCVGNLGSEQRFDYSVLGDSVNVASRLEGQTKLYGVDVIIGQATQALASEYAWLELDLMTVKGKTKPGRIYALLGDAAMASDDQFARLKACHAQMLTAYRRQQWADAARLIDECRRLEPPNLPLGTLYDLYAERIALFRDRPPDPQWDGVFIATSK